MSTNLVHVKCLHKSHVFWLTSKQYFQLNNTFQREPAEICLHASVIFGPIHLYHFIRMGRSKGIFILKSEHS